MAYTNDIDPNAFINSELYFYQQQQPKREPRMQRMMYQDHFTPLPTQLINNACTPPPPPPPTTTNWTSNDQVPYGGLSGTPQDMSMFDCLSMDLGMLDPVPPTIAATPSPTRSHVFFDDVDYQKIRQPPRSTPMIRKQFAARTPNPKRASNRKTSTYSRWTVEEDELLRQAVSIYGPHKWSLVAAHVPNRTPMQCSTRWLGALNPNIHKGRWTEHEDAVLKYSVLEFSGIPDGEGGFQPIPWNRIAERIPNRTGIQCQARWTEALDPTVRKGKWSEEEDALLRAGVEKFGRCWIRIAETVPGRTQRQCRTRWMQIKYKEEKLNSNNSSSNSSKNGTKASESSSPADTTASMSSGLVADMSSFVASDDPLFSFLQPTF